ncbi:MAG TPA: EamA family transporter [Beijerinckiaceae bacterium]|nr:EamA family transporter [Beijerinckiaceae bacterium]
MALRDILAAILVTLIWALNFIAIKIGVDQAPPLFLSGMRFFFAAVPAVFFFPRPKASAAIIISYGLVLGVVQFGLLFVAIRLGMPAGLSSLLMQTQVLFTIAFFALFYRQRPTAAQILGAVVAFIGIALIGRQQMSSAGALPFFLVLGAAAAWGVASVIGKQAGKVEMPGFIVWSSLAAPAPLFLLSYVFEGASGWRVALHPSWTLIGAVAFLAWPSTILAYAIWTRLLLRYPAPVVAPFAFLVPVFGMAAAWVVFGEPVTLAEALGGALILAGLACSYFGQRFVAAVWR